MIAPANLTMTTDLDLAALLTAIDESDDSALLILADWFEEQGDARAAGVRDAVDRAWRPRPGVNGIASWAVRAPAEVALPHHVEATTFVRLGNFPHLHNLTRYDGVTPSERYYSGRGAAYLAIGAALTAE